jgi:hypothetical protein
LIRAVLFLLTVFTAHNASADILQLEREASARHGRPVHCIGWPAECHIMLTKINRSVLPETKATVALTPIYNVVTSYKAVTQINFSDVLALPEGSPVAPSKAIDPGSWVEFTEADEEFYRRLDADGAVNISFFIGYKDQGVRPNPDLFNYGVYAMTIDMVAQFARQWGMEWRQVDSTERIAERSFDDGRASIRLRVIDPHVFCSDERARVAEIEAASIIRGPQGNITGFRGDTTIARGDCAHQEAASAMVKQKLLGTLSPESREDMVFYDGHSRYGKGPDFGPYSSKIGKVTPKELINHTLSAKYLSVFFFNGCSGQRNYGTFIDKATREGKVVIWNSAAPDMLDADDDLLLFMQSVFLRRPLLATERFMNLGDKFGTWPSQSFISLPTN